MNREDWSEFSRAMGDMYRDFAPDGDVWHDFSQVFDTFGPGGEFWREIMQDMHDAFGLRGGVYHGRDRFRHHCSPPGHPTGGGSRSNQQVPPGQTQPPWFDLELFKSLCCLVLYWEIILLVLIAVIRLIIFVTNSQGSQNWRAHEKDWAIPTSEELNRAGRECSICKETFRDPRKLHCSHIFCKSCLENWSKRRGTCPLCRAHM
jgi:hypothetical protein